jgi:hypothetical protein
MLTAAGCAVFQGGPLDVPPGHRLVLGGVDLTRFGESRVLLEIVREDGTFRRDLPVDASWSPFVVTLPPGRYQITRLRLTESGRTLQDETAFALRVEFEVGDAAAVYVGTLTLERVVFGPQLRVTVRDEYERTVPAIRARHPDLPSVVARALLRPT